jgi:catechol 2,3-dioxygenase-like lactoylglutathione lyase family enzyme
MNGPLAGLRFNHLEITLPQGSLAGLRDALVAFYVDSLGFGITTVPGFGEGHLFLTTDPEGSQFIYVAESATPAVIRGEDHLGFHVDDRAAVDRVLELCRAVRARDPRMEIRELEDLELPQTSTHAFYFRYLLPIWIDVQVIEYRAGFAPKRRWRFS